MERIVSFTKSINTSRHSHFHNGNCKRACKLFPKTRPNLLTKRKLPWIKNNKKS